ncbi:MAG: aminopeptidase, partial [Anaeroplasmataceae bacterium]
EQFYIDKKVCKIKISSSNPTAFLGVDPKKLQMYRQSLSSKLDFTSKYTSANFGQWCVCAVPQKDWALKVFPNMSEEESMEKLWEAILTASRVLEDGKVIENKWSNHIKELQQKSKKLNELNLQSLHFKNSIGTDLTVGLANDNIFIGGADYRVPDNVMFSANIPTEEIFCMPHKLKVNGKVFSTKPLSYQGDLIKDLYLEFKDGKVIDYSAKSGLQSLKSLIEFDEGSSYLGEVALVAHNSPISNMNILFYNTLFDENASCHLALGSSYETNMKNGSNLSKEELEKNGFNSSKTHVDFMFGSSDMSVTGITVDGKEITIFENGNYKI